MQKTYQTMNTLEKVYQIFQTYKYVSTDTRAINQNSIFWALKGNNFDGNDFVEEAMEKGVKAAVTSRKNLEDESKNIFYVPDTLKALQDMAIMHRNSLNIPIIAITGTNGKTTTKELIATVLSQKYRISYTPGNRNNHIGVPLSILAINKTIDIGIIEMGANHVGEIKTLCDLARPSHGIITNIGLAHLEGFGCFENIKKTKGELYDYLKYNKGIIFNNADNPILSEILSENLSFSYGKKYAYCIGEYVDINMHAAVKWQSENLSGFAKSNLIGEYNFENILAAITVGLYFNVVPTSIDMAISNYIPCNNRSQIYESAKNTIIKDYYNANPTSMLLAIESFFKRENSEKCLILGDMLELGENSLEEHKKIIDLVAKKDFLKIYFIGENFYHFKNNYDYHFFKTIEELNEYICKNPEHSKFILIKGSRGMKLEKCVDYL